jgi:hypothetical protein
MLAEKEQWSVGLYAVENSGINWFRLLIISLTCQSLYVPTDAQESCFKRMLKFTF